MEYQNISGESFAVMILMIILGLVLPLLLAFIWTKKTKQPVVPILVGAGVFFLFAIVLETIPKALLFAANKNLSEYIMSRTWLFIFIVVMLAGVFEETGRFVAFKYWLKKYTDKKTPITYGIGHGGFEAMYLMVVSGVQNLVFAVMIKTGTFGTIVEQVKNTSPDQLEAMEAIPAALASLTFGMLFFSVLERMSAVLIHISCSVVVFKAVREKKYIFYLLAVLIHAALDVIAGLYQTKIITSTAVVEILMFAEALTVFAAVYKLLYKKTEKENETE